VPKKTEEIKIRVEPLTKLVLLEIAEREGLDLSDVVRRGLRKYVQEDKTVKHHSPEYAHA
jgi:antitoxin component of RelBE/YafQ-DinJ toxin-antitoxin module